MTPHHHWFKSYTHCRTPICLANNTVVYSAGVGNVVFELIVKEKQVKAVEFSRVFYVPDLRSNLLSCLYLTRHKGITINISSHSMIFRQGRKCKGTPNTPLRSDPEADPILLCNIGPYSHHSKSTPLPPGTLSLFRPWLPMQGYEDTVVYNVDCSLQEPHLILWGISWR